MGATVRLPGRRRDTCPDQDLSVRCSVSVQNVNLDWLQSIHASQNTNVRESAISPLIRKTGHHAMTGKIQRKCTSCGNVTTKRLCPSCSSYAKPLEGKA